MTKVLQQASALLTELYVWDCPACFSECRSSADGHLHIGSFRATFENFERVF
jgi:hypothetical protein